MCVNVFQPVSCSSSFSSSSPSPLPRPSVSISLSVLWIRQWKQWIWCLFLSLCESRPPPFCSPSHSDPESYGFGPNQQPPLVSVLVPFSSPPRCVLGFLSVLRCLFHSSFSLSVLLWTRSSFSSFSLILLSVRFHAPAALLSICQRLC